VANVIIVIILLVVVTLGIRETVNHFKGEGACCGGASSKPKHKKLNNKVVHVYTFQVEGMHCQNCANAVIRAINDIEGASAKVSLKRKVAIVSCDQDIDVAVIEEAICKRGMQRNLGPSQRKECYGLQFQKRCIQTK